MGLSAENSFMSSTKAKGAGRATYYKMLADAKQGDLVCIRRGVYASMEQLADTMIDVEAIVPDGILCLLSAFNVHGLTTSLPQAYHVAIKHGRKIRIPEYPSIELHYFQPSVIDLGVEEKLVSGYAIKIYNAERCVCDAVKFRNKVGMDVCTEVVRSYLALPNRNLNRLSEYAKKLRVANILNKYLEIAL